MILLYGLFETLCICVGTYTVMEWIWTEQKRVM
jgi:hypothetical protein